MQSAAVYIWLAGIILIFATLCISTFTYGRVFTDSVRTRNSTYSDENNNNYPPVYTIPGRRYPGNTVPVFTGRRSGDLPPSYDQVVIGINVAAPATQPRQ